MPDLLSYLMRALQPTPVTPQPEPAPSFADNITKRISDVAKKAIIEQARSTDYVSGDDRPIRPAQFEQAFGKEQMFPKQDLRPTSLNKFQDQPYYSMSPYMPKSIALGDLAGKKIENLPYKLSNRETAGVEGDIPNHGWSTRRANLPLQQQLGLGNSTMSIGGTPDKPYLSVFDSWDFAPGSGESELGSWDNKLLNFAGKPYNLYDRIDINPAKLRDPKTNELSYIYPNVAIPNRFSRDINLPKKK